MRGLQRRTAVTVGLLAVGLILVGLGWYQKRGYADLVATGVKATEEGRFENRDFERADANLFASRELLAYNRGVRAATAGQPAAAARYFQEVLSRGASPALRARASYNLGNLLALEGRAREAADMYREALRLDPADWDAKANLERLYRQLEVAGEKQAKSGLTQAREPGEAGDETGQGGRGSAQGGI